MTTRLLPALLLIFAFIPACSSLAAEAAPAVYTEGMSLPATSPNPSPDPEKVMVTTELMQILNMHQQYQKMFDNVMSNVTVLLLRDNPMHADEIKKVVSGVYEPVFSKYEEKMLGLSANAFMSAYSLDELKQIVAFIKTPAGNKFMYTWFSTVQKALSASRNPLMDAIQEGGQKIAGAAKANDLNVSPETDKNIQAFINTQVAGQNSINQCLVP